MIPRLPRRRVGASGLKLALVALVMLGLCYAFVPFYRTFCEWVGIPVPTRGADLVAVDRPAPPPVTTDRTVTIRFMGNVADGLPIEFGPVVQKVDLKIGEETLLAYHATSKAPHDIRGMAIHSVTAIGGGDTQDVAEYIDLVQCFCFNEQLYPAGQDVNLPLSFSVRADLPENVHTITFNYTLYEFKG